MSDSMLLRVLVVDDEPDIRSLVSTYLTRNGVEVYEADNETELSNALEKHAIDVILLDINLGREDGFAIARRLKNRWHGGLLMVTGRSDTVDRVVGLEIGADDYVTKPFELRELIARVRSVARRTANVSTNEEPVSENEANIYCFNDFRLDRARRELCDGAGAPISLTTGEFDLLCALVEHVGVVCSRDKLLRVTHRRDAEPFDRTIDVQIGRLRKKLGDVGNTPQLIKSVRGVGYVLTPRAIK
jgi:two-component system, OmpR family, response regulator